VSGGAPGLEDVERLVSQLDLSAGKAPQQVTRGAVAALAPIEHFSPDSGLSMASRESASGTRAGRIRPLPWSRRLVSPSAKA
jgi:hypothetical protein